MAPPLGLRPLPFRKVARRLRDFGFHKAGQRGSHVKFRHPDGRAVSVPHHARDEIGRSLPMAIMDEAGLDADEFFAAFR